MNRLLFLLAAMVLCFAQPVGAGSQQNQTATFAPQRIVGLAKGVEEYAASKGARAFIIGRVGRPKSALPKGIRFTHTAIAVYSEITLESGEKVNGYAIHNLYQTPDKPARSMLMTDYPVDFFWGAQALEAGIVIPSAEIQLALINLLASGDAIALHNPKYSAIASPFNARYQNCTEYTLDLINAAIYDTLDTARIKRNTNAYFDAQPIHKSRFALIMGSAFMKDITTRDHKGKVKTATFTTIAAYLDKYGLIKDAVVFDETLSVTPLI